MDPLMVHCLICQKEFGVIEDEGWSRVHVLGNRAIHDACIGKAVIALIQKVDIEDAIATNGKDI